MPPIRTAKTNNSSATQDAPIAAPKRRLLKPVVKGVSEAYFRSSVRDWDGQFHRLIGSSTRKVTLGAEFVLTDDHIDDILTLGPVVRKKLTHFIFEYRDVSYDAKNGAGDLTNEAVVRLSNACPSLKVIQLQDAYKLNDDGVIALLKNCPNLVSLEVSPGSSGGVKVSERLFNELRENPEWAPKLKKLIVRNNSEDKTYMKAMRAMTRERQTLTVTLLSRSEYKKWGDWELDETAFDYKKGRVQEPKFRSEDFYDMGWF
ncbi:hypothetical protein FALBO_16775 [Fusarium albosuccineum]|uniref:Uncharacterized protein n=1 Tax=Fusarium albosuccineum TaxID=1237068 RepID=A0A8H4KCB5_9HYPO|nr:hypothetical protein FALBO_16775 [Fusarium albosuccineum]